MCSRQKDKSRKTGTRRKTPIRLRGIGALFAFFITCLTAQDVYACDTNCLCVIAFMPPTISLVISEHEDTRDHIKAEFEMHEDFIENEFWPYMLPALMEMTNQISAVALQQMGLIGMLFDAKHQLETQRLLQAMEAETRDDYEGAGDNVELCIIASNIRTLASSESYAKMNSYVLSQRSQDRQLGNINSTAVEGEHIDRRNRMMLFKERYCDPHDNDGGLNILCPNPPPADTVNLDINYSQLIDEPMTLDIDFCNLDTAEENGGVCEPDYSNNRENIETDIWSLANNLYAHNIFLRIPDSVLRLPENQAKYLDVRAIVAKRSVAENSFNIITGMKTKGSPDLGQDFDSSDTAAYMEPLLQELGIPQQEIDSMLGRYTGNNSYPSYYAQMDVLTKRIYQRPEFYAGLYDNPENIKRRSIAMKAIDLMQNLDTLKSSLRTEMMLSVLLEMGIMELQEDVQNRLNPQKATGKKD